MTAKAIVLAGYGLNCEEETQFAFNHVGVDADIVHVNDLIDGHANLKNYQIMAIPGGFSYGDDTGAGNAYANRMRNNLKDQLQEFIARDTLTIGLCNGCQVMVNLGIVPAIDLWRRDLAVMPNASGRYQCRWVDLKVPDTNCVWLKGIEKLHIPVAHGEGNFYATDELLDELEAKNLIAAQYVDQQGELANGAFPTNPNGAARDIAAVIDPTGRVMAMMPHPERGMFMTQRDDWPLIKEQLKREGKDLPKYGDGMKVFQNAADYFV